MNTPHDCVVDRPDHRLLAMTGAPYVFHVIFALLQIKSRLDIEGSGAAKPRPM